MQGDRTATIVHAIPGRIRVRLGKSLSSPESMQSIMETLSAVEGVSRAEANPVTRSILLLYDPEVMNPEQLYLAAQSVDVAVVLPGSAQPSAASERITPIASSINSTVSRIDRAVFDFTGGKLDARTVVPFGLATAAIRQIVTSRGSLMRAPWYVLLWYSFELFTKFNRRGTAGPQPQAAPEREGR
ncbi:MAG: HMA2 domain-containing protein [Chloroflexota bacterium]